MLPGVIQYGLYVKVIVKDLLSSGGGKIGVAGLPVLVSVLSALDTSEDLLPSLFDTFPPSIVLEGVGTGAVLRGVFLDGVVDEAVKWLRRHVDSPSILPYLLTREYGSLSSSVREYMEWCVMRGEELGTLVEWGVGAGELGGLFVAGLGVKVREAKKRTRKPMKQARLHRARATARSALVFQRDWSAIRAI